MGDMTPSYEKNTRTITVYEKTVADGVKKNNDIKETLVNNPTAKIPSAGEKVQALLDNSPQTITDRIGSVASHEAEHATNEQAQEKYNTDKSSRENIADKTEIEVIKQSSLSGTTPLTPKGIEININK